MSDPFRAETPSETLPQFPKKNDDAYRERPRERRGDPFRALALDAPGPSPSHPPEIPEDRLDPEAIKVIARLRYTGHQAYFVGGCVRDVLLGRVPKDFDVATSAHPGEVRATFRNCRLIGRRFRLAHVYFRGGKVIEVATFRKNPVDAAEDLAEGGDLLITRDNVFGTAEEDARRRDFTVNGLFYDVFAGEVIDYVGGRSDLEARRIATIGEPEIRMREDPVRALRAVRFASRLGFTIEPETFAAMRRHAGELGRCAPPRLLEETFKILRCGASSRAFELLRSSGTLGVLLPALDAFYGEASDEGRRRFLAYLSALDALVHSGEEPSEAVLLGTLLMHLPVGEGGVVNERERLLSELVTTARLPRRIAERARLALLAQRTFQAPLRRRKRGFSSQAYFKDALQLLRINVKATGEGAEFLERFAANEVAHELPGSHRQERASERPRLLHLESVPSGESSRATPLGARGEPAAIPEGEQPGRRRRRRRGGRRRGRRGGTPGGAGGTSTTP
ncbi:MAG TPA: polynucleotide adenylyltransferase PcnB [Anaeromyxobacteraceae bacterium]|nr:polynucleotide adenylyltransferase PcnB [Anaeromyxobacteraceae bacterium]